MGIPFFFSYIIKNHPKIIKKIDFLKKSHFFFLDSNSIIYNCLNNFISEEKLILDVCLKIKRLQRQVLCKYNPFGLRLYFLKNQIPNLIYLKEIP